MAFKVLACLALLALSETKDQTRWSRQISSYTADISDWVPLTGPVEREQPIQIKRQAVAEPRILSEPFPALTRPLGFNEDPFASRSFYNSPPNRQLYLQSVPSAPQNYLSDQGFGQGLRFGLSQPNFPLTQGFVSPQFNFDSVPQIKPKPQISQNPIKFDNFPPIPQFPQSKPILSQAPKQKPEVPKFVDGYHVESHIDQDKRKPQSLHKIRFDNYDKSKEVFSSPKTKVEREEVQLLYVPLESLNKGQFNFRNPVMPPQIVNSELYSQNPKQNPLMQNLAAEIQRPATKPVPAFQPQNILNNYNNQFNGIDTTKYSTLTTPFTTTTPTTPKPKKLKPHQPPLAIFLTQDIKRENDVKVGDVLSSLKNARSVPVLDSVNPLNAPEVFIGPSSLTPPEKYVKFELPYLSNIENKDKKLKQLPFFVAPLSYNTPQGFAKIPFPSPHVGSVVINSQIQESSSTKSTTVADVYPNSFTDPYAYRERQAVTQKPKISYYSTAAPKDPYLNKYEQNYYSFEPQTVSTVRPLKEQDLSSVAPVPSTNSYFANNVPGQYHPSQYINFPQEVNYQTQSQGTNYKPQGNNYQTQSQEANYQPKSQEVNYQSQTQGANYQSQIQGANYQSQPQGGIREYNNYKQETTSTTKASTTLTTKPPTTYTNHLLETHNPYSINQGLQFSAPNEYQNFFDEYKEPYATQAFNPSQTSSATPATVPSKEPVKYEQTQPPKKVTQSYQQENYEPQKYQPQNYQQEVQNIPETQSYQAPIPKEYSAQPDIVQQNDNSKPVNAVNVNYDNRYESIDSKSQFENNADATQPPSYENYSEVTNSIPESQSNIQSTKPDEYNEYNTNYSSEDIQPATTTTTTTTTTTRRTPIRTRGRPRYPTTKPESSDYSTRATVTRRPLRERRPLPNRSRYEPNKIATEKTTRNSDISESTTKSYKPRTRGKLHYKPQEGEEIYEKRTKQNGKEGDLAYQRDILHQNYPVTLMERASTADIEAMTEPTGKESAFENAETTKAEDTENAYSNDKPSITQHIQDNSGTQYQSDLEPNVDNVYIPHTQNEYDYLTKTKAPQPTEAVSEELNDDIRTTPEAKDDQKSVESFDNEQVNHDSKEHLETSLPEIEPTEVPSQEVSQEEAHDDNIVETTPSYNRVRIRPGVIRQYHQASSTQSSRTKNDRRNSVAITYRPAYDKRRTTMRIEEIEADLKTKQIHTRPEFKDYRQPVYKPEPTTAEYTSTTVEASTKRGHFRRRRPSYTTTSTEGTVNRRPYEAKNRFRGRRPTEKPTEKTDSEIDITTTTAKNIAVSKYSHRPKFSERFNKKPAPEEASEDQDPNYSIHRPKYTVPDDRWSPKISGDSFKPYNPNDISEKTKDSDKPNDELDIITVGNEDILISVTPATNTRIIKKVPDIPPTLEALVEQTKVTKSESSDTMSTFETMLEEVMKTLEEQDEDEYTNKVMKHKGGEIGEIPPERIISSGVNYSLKSTTPLQEEITTAHPDESSPEEEEPSRKSRRRGYWKKVKVRPVAEGIETAESQYYSKTVNRLGQSFPTNSIDIANAEKARFTVTTYKPRYPFIEHLYENDDELETIPHIDIPKINNDESEEIVTETTTLTTESYLNEETPTDKVNPGEMDLGTGSPDPTYDDTSYYSEPTEPTSTSTKHDRSDRFSFMDYLFGVTSPEESSEGASNENKTQESSESVEFKNVEEPTNKTTTESTYIPDEFTAETKQNPEAVTESLTTEKKDDQIETTTVSNFMNPKNVISTSMSTEISHETEICFRGKCIKTNKDLL